MFTLLSIDETEFIICWAGNHLYGSMTRRIKCTCVCTLTYMLWCRILGEVVGNFPNFLEEVTLLADPECVRLKNYCKEDS